MPNHGQVQTVTDEQVAKASILVAEAKVYANDAALQISEKHFFVLFSLRKRKFRAEICSWIERSE